MVPFNDQYPEREAVYTRIKQLHNRYYQKDAHQKLENMHSNQPWAYGKFWKSLDFNRQITANTLSK